jgi:hypothetical protein
VTDERMALHSLLDKTPDAKFLRRMMGLAAQRLTELDIERRDGEGFFAQTSASHRPKPLRSAFLQTLTGTGSNRAQSRSC